MTISQRAAVVACYAIAIASILLKPFYPKSAFVGLLVIATAGAILSLSYSIFHARKLAAKYDSDASIALTFFIVFFGFCVWAIYLTLRSLSIIA